MSGYIYGFCVNCESFTVCALDPQICWICLMKQTRKFNDCLESGKDSDGKPLKIQGIDLRKIDPDA